jgi:signal transduction histidine kinase/CheY-like chemotaxis protein
MVGHEKPLPPEPGELEMFRRIVIATGCATGLAALALIGGGWAVGDPFWACAGGINLGLLVACLITLWILRQGKTVSAAVFFTFAGGVTIIPWGWAFPAGAHAPAAWMPLVAVSSLPLAPHLAPLLLGYATVAMTTTASSGYFVQHPRMVSETVEAAMALFMFSLASAIFVAGFYAHIIRLRHSLAAEKASRDFVEARVLERTAELAQANQELTVARDAAMAGERAKSTFLSTMSHEIRTPMNAIIGMSTLLDNTKLSAEQLDYATTIRTAAEHLLTLITDVLDFSRIEAGRLEVHWTSVSLRECTKEAMNLVAATARDKSLALVLDLHPDVPETITADPGGLRQVLVNLLSNAVKFTPAGSVTVSIRQIGEDLQISVIDTGPGISKEGQEWLFMPFVQVDDSANRRLGGTGLGLAISKALCEAMGGRIWVESQLGFGTTFHFTIPCMQHSPPSEAQRAIAHTASTVDEALAAHHPLRILVADDNGVNRKVVAALLRKMGFEPDLCTDGDEAVSLVANNTYHVVLMDLQMPRVGGLEATSQILAMPGPHPWIIALTANASVEDQAACKRANMNDFLSKPVRVEQLQAALLRAPSQTRSR